VAIIGMHALVYSAKAEEARRFFREVLGWRSVDAGDGWPIFTAPPTELAVHPSDGEEYHELYLMCDDIRATVADLRRRGVRVSRIADRGWGLVTTVRLPSGAELGLYEPRHPMAIETGRGRRAGIKRYPKTHGRPARR
jgi:catechol 2,3-dioxygenase-like lactoylglutathione lyase family enzyme